MLKTPVATLALSIAENKITQLTFCSQTPTSVNDYPDPLKLIVQSIGQYFSEYKPITLPVNPKGTPFQQKVWQVLKAIPFGQTRTYGQLATLLDTSARAIGGACRANPIPLIIPCHRVVGKTNLGGFAGKSENMLKIKSWLLAHENGGQCVLAPCSSQLPNSQAQTSVRC